VDTPLKRQPQTACSASILAVSWSLKESVYRQVPYAADVSGLSQVPDAAKGVAFGTAEALVRYGSH